MLACITNRSPRVVADFAAGDGGLLIPAHRQWPNADIVASDTDANAVRRMRRRYPTWRVSRCNFLSDKSIESTAHLPTIWGCTDLVLLNPPFSMRGGQYWRARIDTEEARCSHAMAFLCRATSYLSDHGELVAVMPESAQFSQRDAVVRTLLKQRFNIDIVESIPRGGFPGCAASCVVLRVSRREDALRVVAPIQQLETRLHVVRGSAQLHALNLAPARRGRRLVHTTNLQEQKLIGPYRRVYSERVLRGPCVLLPRVGKLSKEKIVVIADTRPFVLSDCVVAVMCPDVESAKKLVSLWISMWDELTKCYYGTGAPYTTINHLAMFITRVGLSQFVSVCPNPPAPRAVDGSEDTSRSKARITGEMTS